MTPGEIAVWAAVFAAEFAKVSTAEAVARADVAVKALRAYRDVCETGLIDSITTGSKP